MNRGRITLITGASSDVGIRLVERLAEKNEIIWAHYHRTKECLEELGMGERVVPVQADFSDLQSVQGMVHSIAQSGKYPDCIIHLASREAFNKQFHKCTWDLYQERLDISLRSIAVILQAFLPGMAKNRYGKIIFMLSSCVMGIPPGFQSPYVTEKYALLGLMKSLSAEYAGKGITVNAVSPDMMETKFLAKVPDLIVEQNAKKNPRGRNIKIDEVLPAFEYLLSEGADAVTGQNIGVTGGIR